MSLQNEFGGGRGDWRCVLGLAGVVTPALIRASSSTTALCGIWRETRATLSLMNTVLGGGHIYSMSTPASVILPTMQAINGIFGRLDQVAPAAVSADMGTLTSFWNQVVADFRHGTTVGQVKGVYLGAPAGSGRHNRARRARSVALSGHDLPHQSQLLTTPPRVR